MKKIKIILTTILVLTVLFGFASIFGVAAENNNYTFVRESLKSYDGIYMEVKGKPSDNYRKLGVVLDNAISIGENNLFSIKFRNISGANIPISVTLEDENGNRIHTAKSGNKEDYYTHYYIPENSQELQTVKEYYGCINMTKDIQGGELLINISLLKQMTGSVNAISKVFIGLPAAYNVGEKIELLSLQLVKSANFAYNESSGFSLSASSIIDSFTYTDVYDFTLIKSQNEFDALCKSYKLLKCNNDYGVTKSFDTYISSGKEEFAEGVTLNGNCKDGVKFALKKDGNYLSQEENDKFGYIRIADISQSPISTTEALAIKMYALYGNSAFRIIIVEQDGEMWQAGTTAGQYAFADINGDLSYVSTYYNCIWPAKKEGTLTVPYSAMKLLTPGSVDINVATKDGKLTSISEIYLAMDMAESSKEAKNRKIAIATIADVDFTNKTINNIADLTSYGFSDSVDIVVDVNTVSPELSKITTPCSNNSVSNGNWVLGKPTMLDLAAKKDIEKTMIGDVKVLENFEMEDGDYSETDRDIILASFYSTYGESSYLSYTVMDDGKEGLRWQIGNYVNEYQNVSGGYCGLTLDPNISADNWADWQNAKGITMRIKNPQSTEVSFNIAFQQTLDGETIAYRMNYSNAAIYALDVLTGEEFSFRSGAVSAFSSGPVIYLPANFDGWIRIDFSSFGRYSSTGPDEMDFSNSIKALKITSYMLDNSEKEIVFGMVGVYYEEFSVDWFFDGNGKTIKQCLKGGVNE